MPRWPERTDKQRFFEKVEQPATGAACWTWIGSRNTQGYGNFFFGARVDKAHRAAWMLFRGEIPADLCVLHRCDNPRCVNPEHLFLGTKDDNNQDKMRKGRHTWANKTHCIREHPLSGDNLYVTKRGLRMCRECGRIREAKQRKSDRKIRSDRGVYREVA